MLSELVTVKLFFVLTTVLILCKADVYMHNPRGSNNRLDEKSAERRNGNRMFDSQNNNRGGYNVGDKTSNAAAGNEDNQYHMLHFMSASDYKIRTGQTSSYLTLEWTNQHGCGGNEDTDPNNINCNIVLQFMCQPDVGVTSNDQIRDGTSTETQQFQQGNADESPSSFNNRKNGNVRAERGLHEPFEWYDDCTVRNRNKGLFTADQNLKGDAAIYTRQNANGNRNGYECPEERDYFPYWHPTPWRDIAVLAENASMCASHYQVNSFNVKTMYECVENFKNTNTMRHSSKYNNKVECEANGGQWLEFTSYLEKAPQHKTEAACKAATNNGIKFVWARPHGSRDLQCLVALDRPDCVEAPWSRENHLGNTRDGQMMNYTWQIPYFPSEEKQKCVLRIRYNISTDDYDPYKTNASFNQNSARNIQSPVQQNPAIDIGAENIPLRLAINTAQYGRTFQDRSHFFYLDGRPAGAESKRIFNLNVRGKRGNIVQVFPAVEYDFFPTDLALREQTDLVHIQWTGSNTHNNEAPGGDGQTGDAGEGQGGTDRSNIMQIADRNQNYPLPIEKATMFSAARVFWSDASSPTKENIKPEDIYVAFGSSGYFSCVTGCGSQSVAVKAKMQKTLDTSPASYAGMLLQMKKGTYHYACTRNNNFSNRSQKGTMTVE